MDRHLTIQHFVETGQSATNAPEGGWQRLDYAWGRLETNWGVESMRLAAQTSETRVRVTMRYRDDITNAMRLLDGAKTYEIEWIDDAPRRQGFMHVVAKHLASPGKD
jgi:SPP1 family predicted phage head-tail adaptor